MRFCLVDRILEVQPGKVIRAVKAGRLSPVELTNACLEATNANERSGHNNREKHTGSGPNQIAKKRTRDAQRSKPFGPSCESRVRGINADNKSVHIRNTTFGTGCERRSRRTSWRCRRRR